MRFVRVRSGRSPGRAQSVAIALLVAGTAVAVSTPTQATAQSAATTPTPLGYRVVELGREIEINALSERGHVTYLRYEASADVFRAYRWWRGTATPLTPDLPAGTGSRPAEVNESGDVVGYSFEYMNVGGPRAFVWRDGVMTWFDEYTMGVDIDDRGRVVLNRALDGSSYRAAMVVGGREVASPLVMDGTPIWADALGGNGTVVGTAYSRATEAWRGFVWRPGRAPVDLGDLGGRVTSPVQVTDDGTVIGYSDTVDAGRMFRWRDGRMTDLGTLGGTRTDRHYEPGQPDLVNERGDITGSSLTSIGAYHAFRWRHGRMRDLGTLGGFQSHGLGINERGDVVGVSEIVDGRRHAFLWRNGHMYDLDPDAEDSVAVAINDRGQILGYRNGIAVLWEPPRHAATTQGP